MHRHLYSVAATAATVLLGTSAFGAAIRVDVNGQLVGDNDSPGAVTNTNTPTSWSNYSGGFGGGMIFRWDTGGSSNVFSMNYEDEDGPRAAIVNTAGQVGAYPGGHSVLFGSAGAGTTAGTPSTYGIKQTIPATAGKVYWVSGGESASSDTFTNYSWDYGIENGTGVTNGLVTPTGANIRKSGGTMQNGRWTHAIVATGSQVTAHIGLKAVNTTGVNAYADGARVYELDVPVYASLQNGGFEDTNVADISQYNAKGTNGTAFEQQDLLPGWVPLGGSAGQRTNYNWDSVVPASGARDFQFDQNKGSGRMYAMQRVNGGGAGSTYLLTGSIRNDSATESTSRIGIDPTGGLDPTSASVIWSDLSATAGAYFAASINGGVPVTDSTGNGVTVFLASGLNSGSRSGGDSGGRFDNLGLAIVAVPEPTALGSLVVAAGIPLLRRSRRRGA